MPNINLSYYQERKKIPENWFRLSSENGDYTHEGKLRNGNEDYYAVFFYLSSKPNITFNLVVNRKKITKGKYESLEELIIIHNATVKLQLI